MICPLEKHRQLTVHVSHVRMPALLYIQALNKKTFLLQKYISYIFLFSIFIDFSKPRASV